MATPAGRATVWALAVLCALLPLWWAGTRWYRGRLLGETRAAVAADLCRHGQYLSVAFYQRLAALAGITAFVRAEAEHSGRLTDVALAAFWDELSASDRALRRLTLAWQGMEESVYARWPGQSATGMERLHAVPKEVQEQVNACISSGRSIVGDAYRAEDDRWAVTVCRAIWQGQTLWGVATIELDLSHILAESEFERAGQDVQLALRDAAGSVLYGDAVIFAQDPLVIPIPVQNEKWELGGLPAQGWEGAIRVPWLAYLSITLLAVLLIVALVYLGVSRQTQMASAARARTAELAEANAVLERRLARRTCEHSILYGVTALSSKSLDLDALLQRSLDWLVAAMECWAGAVFLADEAEGVLNLRVWSGIPSRLLPLLRQIPVHGGLEGWVFTEQKPLVLADLAGDPRAVLGAHISGQRGYLGVPISSRGRALGVLSLVYPPDRAIVEEDVILLTTVGEQLGVVVENSSLCAAARDRATLDERQRLARELHDSLTQSLYSLTLFAEAGLRWAEDGNLEGVSSNLARIAETVQQALKDIRLLVFELPPPQVDTEGLIGAINHRLNAVERRAGIEARLVVDDLPMLSKAVETQLYQIALQALNNSLQHARASEVSVRVVGHAGAVELEVADNGSGFDPDAVVTRGGMGLATMRERAARMGGHFQVISAPGLGTIVRVVVPEPGRSDP